MRRTNWINLTIIVLIASIIVACATNAHAARRRRYHQPSQGTCRSVVLYNSSQNKTLFNKNAFMRVLPASTAKVLTVLLVMEKLPMDQYVTVGPNAINVQPSKIQLRVGEQYQVKDLLYALLLNSANDASIVLAEAVAGSDAAFAQMMNQRAKQIGAGNTRFVNSNGLPSRGENQFTTAYDMMLIFRQALRYPFFADAIKERYKYIYSKSGRRIFLRSHNKILFNEWRRKIYGKTGYTRKAQACFVGTVQKGNDTLIIGVFGCTDRWGVIKRVTENYGGVDL